MSENQDSSNRESRKRKNQDPGEEDSGNCSNCSHEQCRKKKKVLKDGNEGESDRVEDNEKKPSHKASGETGKETTNALSSGSGITASTDVQASSSSTRTCCRDGKSEDCSTCCRNGKSEDCSICLKSFTVQEVGTPEACKHNFCLSCLQQWVKKSNVCPVDRQGFTTIVVRNCLDGKITGRIPVEPPRIEDDLMTCDVCQRLDSEDRLLTCIECDHYCHLECLDPPSNSVPLQDRSCPNCNRNGLTDAHQEPRCGICHLHNPMIHCLECHHSYHVECLNSPTNTKPVAELPCPNCNHTALVNPNVEPNCFVCRERINQDSKILCRGCEHYYHKECLGMANVPLDTSECPNCKQRGLYDPNQQECEICWENNNRDGMLFCPDCVVYFHQECLTPSKDNNTAPLEGRLCPDCNHTRLIKPDLLQKHQ